MHFMKVFLQSPALLVEHMEVNLVCRLMCISWHISGCLEFPKKDGWVVRRMRRQTLEIAVKLQKLQIWVDTVFLSWNYDHDYSVVVLILWEEERLTQVFWQLVSTIWWGDNTWVGIWCVSPSMETCWSNQGQGLCHLAPQPYWYLAKQDQPQEKIVLTGGKSPLAVAIWENAPVLQSHLYCGKTLADALIHYANDPMMDRYHRQVVECLIPAWKQNI